LKQSLEAAQQGEASFAAERKRVEELMEKLQKLQDQMGVSLQNEHQFLVTEKAHLTAELQKREDFESSTHVDSLHQIVCLM